MVNTVVTVKPLTQTEQAKARLARVNAMRVRPGLRVEPAGKEGRWTADDMRRLLRHPRAGGFRSEGSIEWPDDTFTKRRLKEGSIKLAAPAEEKKPQPEKEHQARREPKHGDSD